MRGVPRERCAMLGCPYHCSFCCIQAPFKHGEQAAGLNADVNSYRFWSPARVVAPTSVNGGRLSLMERAAGPSPIMMSSW